jgi:hypothetical protein
MLGTNALAPTQKELPFLIAQGAVILIFVVLGAEAIRSFHPPVRTGSMIRA